MISHTLDQLGWTAARAQQFEQYAAAGLLPARVIRPERGACVVAGDGAVTTARLQLDLSAALSAAALPTVGDWVACSPDDGRGPAVRAVMPRTSAFLRHAVGGDTVAQALAANVDTVFVVVPLNRKLNLTRIERFLTLGWESGATPVLLLSKADVCDDLPAALEAASSAAPGVDVLTVSAVVGDGVPEVLDLVTAGATIALLGQSGAGKSTLVNALAGENLMATQEIRSADGRGRHTTTHRELLVLPAGGILIDTPGLRTLLLWDAEEGLERAFEDVEQYVAHCRFHDCGHRTEPGCAVLAAVASGELPARRVESHRKLQSELAFLANKQDKRLQSEQRKNIRVLSKAYRQRDQLKPR
ncbi:MAG: ribosome small subunit-dependent GTPase A [Actinomycetota bacterium]